MLFFSCKSINSPWKYLLFIVIKVYEKNDECSNNKTRAERTMRSAPNLIKREIRYIKKKAEHKSFSVMY